MSAQIIYNTAPLGAIISFSDGTSRPPERHRKKLAAWKYRNGCGRLIQREPERRLGNTVTPATFILQMLDQAGGAVSVIRVHRMFSVGSRLSFTIEELPSVGTVRVLDGPEDNAELVHLTVDRREAEVWLARHGYPRAVLEEVAAEAVAASPVEGRDAA